MKRLMYRVNLQLSTFILLIVLMISCTNQKDKQAASDQYTCSMHPQIIQDMPGTCPICGMDLVLKSRPGEEVKITKELNYSLKPVNASIISAIKTVTPIQKAMPASVEAKGMIIHNTRKIATIAARFSGRIEKLYIKYNLQPIHKGQKIMEIYSPDLVTAQRELLYLITSDSGNVQLIRLAKQKLILLGLSEHQVNMLASSKQESYSFPIYSTTDGYIAEHSMTEETADSPSNSDLSIREGMYVSAGQSIFTIVSHVDLWAEFNIYQRDVRHIKVNDPVTITFDNSYGSIKETVDFIQPFFNKGEEFTKVRVHLANAHHHHHAGQLVTATFISTLENSLWIPIDAKLDLGTQDVAFVKRRGVFRPKIISTGFQSGKWLQLLEGLDVNDSIAYNAQFMVDSESFIQVNSK